MLVLGINTATEKIEIALVEIWAAGSGKNSPKPSPNLGHGKAPNNQPPFKTLFQKSWKSNRDEMEKVLPVVAEALKKANSISQKSANFNALKKPAPLGQIFIVSGPGPFTSLRLGVTIANTLAFLYDIPIISCDTSEYEKLAAESVKPFAKKSDRKKDKTIQSAKFSQIIAKILQQNGLPKHKLVKPIYLQPPKITQSKKQIFA